MNEVLINTSLDHIERALIMFKKAIIAFPEIQWKQGDLDYLRPAGVAYHVVETIEFYTGNIIAEQFEWGHRFHCDWEDTNSTKLPNQDEVLTYLGEVWEHSQTWIRSHNLLEPESMFPWTGDTLLGRMLYILRHIQHHTAEMSLELKRRGYECPDWK